MYELFVLACLMQQPNMCVTLKDLYSPHNSHDKCLTRAYEIAKGMPIHMPMYFPKSYKCLARAYEIARGMPIHMPMYFPKSYKCLNMETEGNKIKTKWHTKKEKQPYSRNMD